MKTISKITIQHIIDETPDTSFIGEYSDRPKPGSIVTVSGVFIEKIEQAKQLISDLENIIYDEDEKDSYIKICEKRRDNIQEWIDDSDRTERNRYKYFHPYAGGEEVASPYYKKYAMQDFNRMEAYSRGDFHFIGIELVAYSVCDCCKQEKEVSIESLWSIESDSDLEATERDLFGNLEYDIRNNTEYENNLNFDDCMRID